MARVLVRLPPVYEDTDAPAARPPIAPPRPRQPQPRVAAAAARRRRRQGQRGLTIVIRCPPSLACSPPPPAAPPPAPAVPAA